jgi:hypothetical protein
MGHISMEELFGFVVVRWLSGPIAGIPQRGILSVDARSHQHVQQRTPCVSFDQCGDVVSG